MLPQAGMLSCQRFLIQMGFFSAQQLQARRRWPQGGCPAGCSASGSSLLMCQHQQFWRSVSLCTRETLILQQPGERKHLWKLSDFEVFNFLPQKSGLCCWPGHMWARVSLSDGALPSCCGAWKACASTLTGATRHLRSVGL